MAKTEELPKLEDMYLEAERNSLVLEAKREELRLYEQALKEREKVLQILENGKEVLEQTMVEARMLKLVAVQKEEELQLYRRITELQIKLYDKHQLELELKRMRVVVAIVKHLEQLEETLREKEEDLRSIQDIFQALIVKERYTNDELQDARQELIQCLIDWPPSGRASIGIKKMGELAHKVIHEAANQKFPESEAQQISSEYCTLFEIQLRDPKWHPFKAIMVGGEVMNIVDEDDDRLKDVKNEWGDEVHKAVVKALVEINENNPSGSHPIPELWNFKEDKKATLGECLDFILRIYKSKKRKRNLMYA